jgi:hypothetical protein
MIRRVLSSVVILMLAACATLPGDPNIIPPNVLKAWNETSHLAAEIPQAGFKFETMRFKSVLGHYITWSVIKKENNRAIIFYENETMPSMWFGHKYFVGSKIVAGYGSDMGQMKETWNDITNVQRITPQIEKTVINGESVADLSYSFSANSDIRSGKGRTFDQTVTAKKVVSVKVNGTDIRLPSFIIRYNNVYDLGVRKNWGQFVYLPSLGAHVSPDWSPGRYNRDYSFTVSNARMKELQVISKGL